VVPPDPTRQCLELAAGCVYEHSQYPNAFQWIELSSTGKRVRVLPRAWLHSAWSIDRNQPNCHDGYSAFEFGGDSVEPPIPPGRLVFKAFGTGNEDPFSDNLPPDAWKCYEDLFPIPTERDKFEDVLRWVNQGRHYANGWKELLCTMQEGTRCVGFAFISLYPPLGWWFGNYFGVNKSYRENGRASTFLRFIRERCESIERNSKGLIFEVERYEEKHIQGIIAKCEASQSSRPKRKIMLTPEEKYSLDALRRIALYTVRGLGSGLPNALAVVTKDKTDHPFLGK
jgi:hypothetical protein